MKKPIIRSRDLNITEPQYGFFHNDTLVFLTMEQVSDLLGSGETLVPVGPSKAIWGDGALNPEDR